LGSWHIADLVRADILQLSGEHVRAALLVASHLLSDGPDEGAA
jgi:hypothetical protein